MLFEVRAIAASVLVFAACARREDAPIERAPEQRPNVVHAEPAELPVVRTRQELARADRQRAVVEGVYEIAPLAGGEDTQPAAVVLVDGTRVVRALRPVPEELAFDRRRVRAIGTVSVGPPDARTQALGGPRVLAERVELRAGEAPITPTPTSVPTPPQVTTIAGFAPHLDRWVAVTGTLESLAPLADATRADAELRLADGGLVTVDHAVEADFRPFVGRLVTAIGRASVTGRGGALSVRLVGARAPCLGVAPRCGMTP